MSGETANRESGWTVDTLKEHILSLRADDKEALRLALEASEKAVDKAEEAQLRVNTTQNEFRGALKDQAATLLPRSEYNVNHESLQKQVDALQKLVYVGVGGILVLQIVLQFFT